MNSQNSLAHFTNVQIVLSLKPGYVRHMSKFHLFGRLEQRLEKEANRIPATKYSDNPVIFAIKPRKGLLHGGLQGAKSRPNWFVLIGGSN